MSRGVFSVSVEALFYIGLPMPVFLMSCATIIGRRFRRPAGRGR